MEDFLINRLMVNRRPLAPFKSNRFNIPYGLPDPLVKAGAARKIFKNKVQRSIDDNQDQSRHATSNWFHDPSAKRRMT